MIAALLAALAMAQGGDPAPPAQSPPATVAAPPALPSVLGYFESFCLQNAGKPDAALKASETAGWMPVPRKMAPVLPPNVTEAKARIRSDSKAMYRLSAGRSLVPLAGLTWDGGFCSVSGWPADIAATKVMLETRLGVSELATDEGSIYYAYVERDGRARTVDPDAPGSRALLAAGQIQMIVLSGEADGGVSLIHMQPQRVTDDVDPAKQSEQVT